MERRSEKTRLLQTGPTGASDSFPDGDYCPPALCPTTPACCLSSPLFCLHSSSFAGLAAAHK
ncbi:MAG: hypothetical protein ACK55Z_35940, partial [bacterium]